MKVLMFVQAQERIDFSHYYREIGRHCDLDLHRLSKADQADLRRYCANIDLHKYDRVIIFLRFKLMIRQVVFLAQIPNLVLLEHDAVQNYHPLSKYQGKFLRHYRALPWVRVLCSGYQVTQRLIGEGVDAVFVPKGFDDSFLSNQQHPRTIEVGFLGSTKSQVYSERLECVLAAKERLGVEVLQTDVGAPYCDALNQMRFFLCPDVNLGEYMIKNFEAMACGCVLLTYDQGVEENRALGFEDGVNVVLFSDLDELEGKLNRLRESPEKVLSIAQAGERMVLERFSYRHMAENLVNALKAPLRTPRPLSWVERLRAKTYR